MELTKNSDITVRFIEYMPFEGASLVLTRPLAPT